MKARMLAGALTCACSAESGRAEVDCDAVAVPLLELAADERAELVGRAGDDWVFEVRTYPADLDDIAAGDDPMLPIAHRVETVGGCGEEARIVGDGLDWVDAPPQDDLPWIARTAKQRSPQGLWLVDPHAKAPLVRLTSGIEDYVRTESGAIVVDGNGSDRTWLSRVEVEVGRSPVMTTEREGIRELAPVLDGSQVYERVAFVTEVAELTVRELATGAERIVRSDVVRARMLDASGDRFYVTTTAAPSGVVIDDAAGLEIELLSGSDVEVIGSASVAVGPTWLEGILREAGQTVETHQVLLPDLRELRHAGDWTCVDCGRRHSDAILLRGPEGIYRVDPESDTPVLVGAFAGSAVVLADRIRVYDAVAVEPPALGVPTYRLLDMALDGTDVRDVLGEEANDIASLGDGRWAYVRGVDHDGDGELVVLDEGIGERRVVAGRVGADVGWLSWALVGDEGGARLLYHQRGDDEVEGVWLVDLDRVLD